MIVLEGLMMVPPERGTIIGRAVWKPRYVVFGTGCALKTQNDLIAENNGKVSSSRKGLKSSSSRPSVVDLSTDDSDDDGLYISIYKAKGDWELVSQTAISAFQTCEIRALAHRKQGPSLPTLMLEMKPDLESDKARRRRSSRTGGLTSKDPWANILLFRSVPEERYNIYDWQVMMKPQLIAETRKGIPTSPTSPTIQFTNFTNPFAKESRTAPIRPELQQRVSERSNSTYPHAPRDRPSAIISPSPSLRSRRSDLSSQASSQHPPMGFAISHSQNYTTALPTDVPSPASTSYEHQFIEGWTMAQGRSSTLSSHTRRSNSIASAVAPPGQIASTPPGPRETILDRAFQMRCIPGSERISEQDEDQLSSMARFEALMREVDERKQQAGGANQNTSTKEAQSWDIGDDSEEDSDSAEPEIGNDDDSDDADEIELDLSDDDLDIPAPTQRALEFISGRRTPIPSNSRPLSPTPRSPPVPYLSPQMISAFQSGALSPVGLRPRTGTNSSTREGSRPTSLIAFRSVSVAEVPNLKDVSSSTSSNLKTSTDVMDKRQSSTSVKRLSFHEFARRLSSTSSLLLVQSNVSNNSGVSSSRRTSTESINENERHIHRCNTLDHRDLNCGWRGSVGAFGEGGFL